MSEPSKRHKYVGTNTNGEAQTYKRGREGGKYKGVGTDMGIEGQTFCLFVS